MSIRAVHAEVGLGQAKEEIQAAEAEANVVDLVGGEDLRKTGGGVARNGVVQTVTAGYGGRTRGVFSRLRVSREQPQLFAETIIDARGRIVVSLPKQVGRVYVKPAGDVGNGRAAMAASAEALMRLEGMMLPGNGIRRPPVSVLFGS